MSKKLCAVLVVMLCLTAVFPALSMSTGSADVQNNRAATSSGKLKVDAWVESKIVKAGDTIQIYANTSYITGVSVSADIMEYEHNASAISSFSLGNLNPLGIISTVYVTTISLNYDSSKKCWVGEYTIPGTASGGYVADVKATDGTKIARDNATVHLQKFYDKYLKPVQNSAITFLYGEFNDTVNDIEENLTVLKDTINAHGGIRGIVENITSLPEWEALLDVGYQGSYETKDITAFLDNLTKFILSDEYENIMSMIPELESFILGIPTDPNTIVDYLFGFNLTHYLEKIAGTEGVIAAYNLLMSSDEYAAFQNALDALALETYSNMQNLSSVIEDLLMSEELMNLLNTTVEYLQGNDTALQNLINSFIALDGNFYYQLENLIELPEFYSLMSAVMSNTNLSEVFESINTTYNNISSRVMQMISSTQFQDLITSTSELNEYMAGGTIGLWRSFSGNETFSHNYTVKDWMKGLCIDSDPYFSGHGEFVDDTWTWVPGTGHITVTLTDPNGIVHTYTESYNGSGGMVPIPEISEYGKHDYTILFPTPGNWTINVATYSDSGGYGTYNLEICPKDDFMTSMLKESIEELFFVFNAGIAIETEYFQTIGTNGSAKLVAYDANGRLANTEINVIVSRNTGGILGASGIIPAAILYVSVLGTKPAGIQAPVAALSVSQYDDEYGVTITSISTPTSPYEVEWYLLDAYGIAQASGDMSALGYTSNDVTVTWNDNDGNSMLSAGDTISIYKSGDALGGYKFRLMHVPTGSIMCEITIPGGYAKNNYCEKGEVEVEYTTSVSIFDIILPYIKTMEEINAGVVYEGKVTTDSNGEATINFPVEKFGIYSIEAYFEDENKIGFGISGFIGESYVPEIGLTQIGKFAGVPVYMSPNKIGENITFNVNVPEGENASVAISPPPLGDLGGLLPNLNMSYESSDTTITGPGNVTLQVNGPVSIIAVATGMPTYEEEEEYPQYMFAMSSPYISGTNATFNVVAVSPGSGIQWNEITWQIYNVSAGVVSLVSPTHIDIDGDGYLEAGDAVTVDTGVPGYYTLRAIAGGSIIFESAAFVTPSAKTPVVNEGMGYQSMLTIPQFNISFGILLTSDVNVTITAPTVVKGERATLTIAPTSGIPIFTVGLAAYSNGIDVVAQDLKMLSTILYRTTIMESAGMNTAELISMLSSVVWGFYNRAYLTVPVLSSTGDYSIISITNVDGTKLGTAFTQVSVYPSGVLPTIPPVASFACTIGSGVLQGADVNITLQVAGTPGAVVNLTLKENNLSTNLSVTRTPGPPNEASLHFQFNPSKIYELVVERVSGGGGSSVRVIINCTKWNISVNHMVFNQGEGTEGSQTLNLTLILDYTTRAHGIVVFDATQSYDPDGVIQQYFWSFGDGSGGVGVVTHHEYLPGNYTVALTLIDDDSTANTTYSNITVLDITELYVGYSRQRAARIDCPANLLVTNKTDPSRYIGYKEGILANNITGATAITMGDAEIYLIPLTGDYTYKVSGTGVGTYTFKVYEPGDFEPGDFEPGDFEPGDFNGTVHAVIVPTTSTTEDVIEVSADGSSVIIKSAEDKDYSLIIKKAQDEFIVSNVTITAGATHTYNVNDWAALETSSEAVSLAIDINSDGISELTTNTGSGVSGQEFWMHKTTEIAGKTIAVSYQGIYIVNITAASQPSAIPEARRGLGLFIKVTSTGDVSNLTITISYKDSDLPADADESTLRMYYWNETLSQWVLVENSGVWLNNNTVWAKPKHLTIFAPMAEEVAAAPALFGPIIYIGAVAAIIAVLISVVVVAKKRKK